MLKVKLIKTRLCLMAAHEDAGSVVWWQGRLVPLSWGASVLPNPSLLLEMLMAQQCEGEESKSHLEVKGGMGKRDSDEQMMSCIIL